MQNWKTMERGSTSCWHEKCFHDSGHVPVYPVTLPRRHFRYALWSRGAFVLHRELTAVLLFCPGNSYCNKGGSNLAISGIAANWVFRPPNPPSRGKTWALSNTTLLTWGRTSVPAKWYLIPSNGFRPTYIRLPLIRISILLKVRSGDQVWTRTKNRTLYNACSVDSKSPDSV